MTPKLMGVIDARQQITVIRREREVFLARSAEAEIEAVHRMLASGTSWAELSRILQITDRQARNRYGSKRQRNGERGKPMSTHPPFSLSI
jgi:hypothetical protein